jgi:hypothetical protein
MSGSFASRRGRSRSGTSEYLDATRLIALLRRDFAERVVIIRVPNLAVGGVGWPKQCAEGAEEGQSDYFFGVDGKLVAWELKTKTGKRSPAQVRYAENLDRRRIPNGYGVWRDCLAFLKEHLRDE